MIGARHPAQSDQRLTAPSRRSGGTRGPNQGLRWRRDRKRLPGEPPLAGTEAEHLTGALDRLRTTFRWKADDLDAAGLQARIGASSLTLGGLVKHLAVGEEYMFTTKLRGETLGAPWDPPPGTAMTTGSSPPPPTTPPNSSKRCGTGPSNGPAPRLEAALADGGLGQLVHVCLMGMPVPARRVYCP